MPSELVKKGLVVQRVHTSLSSTYLDHLIIPTLTSQQRASLIAYLSQLPPADPGTPSAADLMKYQTPVKSQIPRGTCTAFALMGAIEACYKRRFNLELDLSEEYFIHIVHSSQSTHDPSLKHENVPSEFSMDDPPQGFVDGAVLMPKVDLAVPQETYAPYFGDANASLFSNATYHSYQDTAHVQVEAGLADRKMGDRYSVHRDANGKVAISQQAVDDFEYNTRHIPFEARKQARYGATEIKFLSWEEFRQDSIIQTLESCILAEQEVVIGFGGGSYSGHAMLLIGYDRTNQKFLFKNSWGDIDPYPSISYEDVKAHGTGGAIVTDVRAPVLGPDHEVMWLGKWQWEHFVERGVLVLRRTRATAQELGTVARLGSLYLSGVPHMVTGYIDPNTDRAHLFVDYSHPEGPPYTQGTPVQTTGQEFVLELSEADHFDVAKGMQSGPQYVSLRRMVSITGWNEVPGSGTTDVALAAATFNSKIYLFGKGVQNRRIYVTTRDLASKWSAWTEVPGGGVTDAAVTAIVFNNRLYLFHKGLDQRIYMASSTNGIDWSNWSEVPGNGMTDVAVTATLFNNRLHLICKGIDKHIYLTASDNMTNWTGWLEVPGNGTTNASVAAITFRDHLYLVAKWDQDRHIYINSYTDALSWSGWTELPGAGTTTTDVGVGAAIWDKTGTLYLLSVHPSDRAIYAHTTKDGSTWSHTRIGGPTTVTPTAVSQGTSFYMFAKSLDHRVCFRVDEWIG